MKASVNLSVMTTVTVLATMSLLVACGSKKNKPADEEAAAAAPATTAQFDGTSVSCLNSAAKVLRVETILATHLTLNDKKEFTLASIEDGKAVIQSGTFAVTAADVNAQTNETTGKLNFATKSQSIDGKVGALEKSTESQFISSGKDSELLEVRTLDTTGASCEKAGDTLVTKMKIVSGSGTVLAKAVESAKAATTAQVAAPDVGGVQPLPAPPTASAAPAPATPKKADKGADQADVGPELL